MIDGTLGDGGHAAMIAAAIGSRGRLISVDRDAEMIQRATTRLVGVNIDAIWGNFSELDRHLAEAGLRGVDGILLDLGVASLQIDDRMRGFSFREDGPLDMRMTPDASPSAAAWLNRAPEHEIARVIWEYGEERHSRRIARAIVRRRDIAAIRSTGELADIILRAMPRRKSRLHPARRSFQAIRIFINREIANLERFLEILPGLLNAGGRCVIISYHSLEDRPVKNAFVEGERQGVYQRLTRKPLRPSPEEVQRNPRARSAKVRAVRHTAEGGTA
jgi:16S rRNA (cytosine1402-N4)-methyltransferase